MGGVSSATLRRRRLFAALCTIPRHQFLLLLVQFIKTIEKRAQPSTRLKHQLQPICYCYQPAVVTDTCLDRFIVWFQPQTEHSASLILLVSPHRTCSIRLAAIHPWQIPWPRRTMFRLWSFTLCCAGSHVPIFLYIVSCIVVCVYRR